MQPQPERSTCAFELRPLAAQNELIRDQQVFRKRTEWNCYFPKILLQIKERRSIFPRSSSVKPTILFSK
uniref:Putative ovule protein n=1 Tax=Solanum chacoense TaxID=4108 RepID=A0A0V0GHH1_SOLCH